MTHFDLFSLRDVFADQGVMICFNGPFSHSVIEELGTAVRKYLESDAAPKDRIADVFAVFVEQAQNLKNYTSNRLFAGAEDGRFRHGTLVIARENDSYIVSSGNLVGPEDVARVKTAIESVSGLDKVELKTLYKQRLRTPVEPGRGAGLGFIDMARRATAPIACSFRELADGNPLDHEGLSSDGGLPAGTVFFNVSVFI
ncbi:MAG TPA: SiaB family protein kinase [Spirochaetia bacterium]|nr:SiaB family protein kinase [Spirochaetia bacterium]